MKEKFFARRNVFIILLLLLTAQYSFSQNNFKVTGKVTDETGQPVQGATVKVKGTALATATDSAGAYSLMAPRGTSRLVITSVGFTELEVAINNRREVNVSIVQSSSSLNDVVVIGYATVKRKDVTGSVAGINQNDIRSRPVENALEAMQGKVAGVDIVSNERPGQVDSINIRGARSLSASNSPLFVVDGIPLTTGGIEYLNPNDIETIDVLKDASATAIFGSRGANGVVIVTTKQGKAGKLQLNLYNAVTFETIRDWAPMMSASEYIDFRRWAIYYSNPSNRPRGDQPTIANDREIFLATADPSGWANIAKGWAGGTWDGSKVGNTNWTDMVSQTGVTTDNTISVSGGTDKLKAYASFGYLNNKGTSIGQQFTRFSGKASVDIKATDWFNMGLTINVTQSTQEFGQSQTLIGSFVGTPATSIYESARRVFRHAVPYDSAGNIVIYPGGDVATKSIVNEWNLTQDQRTTLRAFGSLYAQLDFGAMLPVLKGLKYRLNFGPDFADFTNGIYIDGQSTASSGINGASLQESETRSWTLDNLLYYDKEIKKHSFGLTLLQSATKFVADPVHTVRGTGIPFASQKWNALNSQTISAGNLSITQNSDLIKRQLVSYMARLNYGFDDKYLLTVSLRSDGASQLYDDGNKFSLFPSAALAWRVNREDFMKNAAWLNDLKFRVGTGVTGNSAIAAYATKGRTVPLFYPFSTAVTAGSLPSDTLANQSLDWEKTTQYNFGIDFSIFQRRISGTIDLYTSQTKDLLMARSIPTVTGFRVTYQNVGQTANRGVDLNINTVNIATKAFQWSTNFNASWQKDRIVSLANGKQNDINNNWFIDAPLSVIYGFASNGLWQYADTALLSKFTANGSKFTAGNVRPVDQNGDNKIDANHDQVIIGHTRPRFIVGMTNSFSYKNFDLSFFIYGRLNYWFNTGGEAQTARGNQRKLDYWTENNQNSEYQKPIYSVGSGDPYAPSLGYQKASFLKIRNISASYTFSPKMLEALRMSNLRVYFQAANPGMLFSQIKFMDMDAALLFSNRGFTFGINAGF